MYYATGTYCSGTQVSFAIRYHLVVHQQSDCMVNCRQNGAGQKLDLQFQGPEASQALNFVIKDNSTGRWYDYNGDNFHVPLSLEGDQTEVISKPKEKKEAKAPLTDAQMPQLPDELCGIWAYITWEAAGCPNRSQEESSREFQNAIKVKPLPA